MLVHQIRFAAIGWKSTPRFYFVKRSPVNLLRTALNAVSIVVALVACERNCAITRACNVPVFRYALERWHPDLYRVTLFHQGSLTEPQEAFIRTFEASSGGTAGNAVLRLVDVDKIEDDVDRALLATLSPSTFPWVVVQYPQSLRIEKLVWSGPLTTDALAQLIASPLRTELTHRLVEGQTAIWLMLESGQAEKDDAVAAMLKDELEQLSHQLELPELTSAPEDNLLLAAPLEVKFSLLRVPRGASGEQLLVEMLLGSEPDLAEFDEPMVFPIFGRGRALLPLIGAGITTENVHEAASLLVGACSCEVKDLNPGFDLLLAADWDVLLFKEAPPAGVLVARASVTSGEPQLVDIPPGAPHSEARVKESESIHTGWFESNRVVSLALISLLVAVVALIACKRLV